MGLFSGLMGFHMVLELCGLGVGVGILSSMLGIGGGSFIVPLLVLLGLVGRAQEAVGTSIFTVFFMGLSATIAYGRRGTWDWRLALWTVPGALAGAWGSASWSQRISSGVLLVAFGTFLGLMALFMALGQGPGEIGGRPRRYLPYPGGGILVGLLAGVTAGLFGLGGGTIMVPGFTLLLGVDIRRSIATSLMVMVPAAAISTLEHALQGDTLWDLALPLALGMLIGGQLGPRIGGHIPRAYLRRLFSLALLYGALQMILKGLRP